MLYNHVACSVALQHKKCQWIRMLHLGPWWYLETTSASHTISGVDGLAHCSDELETVRSKMTSESQRKPPSLLEGEHAGEPQDTLFNMCSQCNSKFHHSLQQKRKADASIEKKRKCLSILSSSAAVHAIELFRLSSNWTQSRRPPPPRFVL